MKTELIDLGRPIVMSDIVDDDTGPINSEDSGHVYCYECQGPHKGSIGDLSPLTTSSGVFTSSIRCSMDSAVYVCLEHVRGDRTFDAFSDDVRAVLLAKLHARSATEVVA